MFSVCPHLGGYPVQVQIGAGVPQPHQAGGGGYQRWGTPQPGQDIGYPRWGTPWQDGVPGGGQQMKYLIRRGRYASCVHAGGLSCFNYSCHPSSQWLIQYFPDENTHPFLSESAKGCSVQWRTHYSVYWPWRRSPRAWSGSPGRCWCAPVCTECVGSPSRCSASRQDLRNRLDRKSANPIQTC